MPRRPSGGGSIGRGPRARGRNLPAQGEDDKALEHYLAGLGEWRPRPDFIRLLLQMLSSGQRYQEAEQVIQPLESNQVTVPHDVAEMITEIFARGGDFDRALQMRRQGLQRRLGRLQRTSLAREDAQNPCPPRPLGGPFGQTAANHRRRGKVVSAQIEIAPTAADCRVELVLLLVFADQKAKALKAAEEAEFMVPSNVAPLALGYIYDALGKTEKAAASYEKALAQHADNTRVVRTLAEFYLRNRDPRHAAPLVDKLLSGQLAVSEADRTIARRLKAELLFEQGHPNYKEALALSNRTSCLRPVPPRTGGSSRAFFWPIPPPRGPARRLSLLEGLVKPFGAAPNRRTASSWPTTIFAAINGRPAASKWRPW